MASSLLLLRLRTRSASASAAFTAAESHRHILLPPSSPPPPQQQQPQRLLLLQRWRWYTSRAHPQPKPSYPVETALNMILAGIEERKIKREGRWERNKDRRARMRAKQLTTEAAAVTEAAEAAVTEAAEAAVTEAAEAAVTEAEAEAEENEEEEEEEGAEEADQTTVAAVASTPTAEEEDSSSSSTESTPAAAKEDEGPYRNMDETIEVALNLNLDPRKPGQALRGSLGLPHGAGKTNSVVVFTSSKEVAAEAIQRGAKAAGGDELIERIASGEVPVDFDRSLSSPDMVPRLGRKLARILGPRGLMPNAKVGNIQDDDRLLDALKDQQSGLVQYRTDKAGIVHAGIARGSFGKEKILENLREFMNGIQEVKPDSFGKGKKKGGGGGGKKGGSGSGKNTKYYLKAHLTATQGKGVQVDLRTLDPTSAYFMGKLPE